MKKSFTLLILFFACFVQLMAQSRTITGRVTDEKGNGLANASVLVKGTSIGTTTNNDGVFTLNVPGSGRVLVVSYVGLADKEISVSDNTSYQVTMSASNKADMQEIVVVAYGTQTKRNVTGSVIGVNSAQLENRPFTTFVQSLQGRVPGLHTLTATGQPGAAPQVRIRGIGSISAGAGPIYVIDGVIVNSGDLSRNTNESDALSGLNPNDIESVSVLKDAAATAIYGSLGSNGVILVTTKKGRAGKTKVRIDADYGRSDVAYLNDLAKPLNKQQYLELTKEGLINAGATQAQIDNNLNALGANSGAETDWLGLVTRKGDNKSINASLSGGDAKTTFYVSGGYTTNQAVIIGSDFKRYSGTVNLKHKAGERFTMGVNATGSFVDMNAPYESSNFRNPVFAAFLRPTIPVRNADGSLNMNNTTFNQLHNPLVLDSLDREHLNNVKIVSSINGVLQIFRDLSFSSQFGVDHINIEEDAYWNPFHGDGRTVQGYVFNYGTRNSRWTFTNILNYKRKLLGDNLDLDFKVGYEANKSKEYQISAYGSSLPMTALISLPAPSTPVVASGGRTDFSYASAFSIAQLNFLNRYSLSGSFRRDGSSRFGTNSKYGDFWSVGVAWNIDQEAFMKDINFINALKLRSSYGKVGNAQFTNYGWRGSYSFGSTYNQQPGSAPSTVGNPELSWEVSKPFNVGLDLAAWRNRLSLTAEYYNKQTTDLLYAVPLALSAGTSAGTVNANIGAMENKGFEFQLNVTPVKFKDFVWDVNFNIALNKNKILKLPSNNILDGNKIRRIGEDFQSIWTRQWAGVDPATGAPQWFTDSTKTTKTGNAALATRSILGSASPKGFGGFGTNLEYKGFGLNAQFSYQYGNLVYDNWGFLLWSDGSFPTFNKNQKQLRRWQKPGDITDLPKYVYGGANNSNAESSRWYYKGDFVRLRDVTLSYSLPRSIASRAKLDNAKFYVRGSNLWTKAFDENITFDPEQPINGTSDLQIYIPKTITFGLTLGF